MARFDSTREQVTDTGIRIVGQAAAELVARATALPLAAPAAADLLWIARFRARPRLGAGSPVPAMLQTIESQLRSDWDACPALTRDSPFSRPAARFQGILWDVDGTAGTWRGELAWRHPHPVLPGTPCITHLVIDEQQQSTTLTLAAAADGGRDGVRGFAGAGQARPALLDLLSQTVTLTADGFDRSPQILADTEVTQFVHDVLLSDRRSWPVAVLAPQEQGGYLVPPEQLAAELFGLAPLYVLDRHSATFRLTDAVGDRRLSAYWGALRVYRPEFSCADRSDDHWLLTRERVDDPVERAALIGKLGRLALDRHLPVEGVRARREARQPIPPVTRTEPTASQVDITGSTTGKGESAATPAALPTETLAALSALPAAIESLAARLSDLSGTVAHLVITQTRLADEISRLRTTTAIRAGSSNAVERRLARIEALLSPPEAVEEEEANRLDAEEDSQAELSLVDVVRHAASEYSEALLLLDSAEATAKDSPYEDIDRVAAVLQAMAFVARRRQEGGLDTGLRAAFLELGVDYRAGIAKATSDKLRRQYGFVGPEGRVYECPEHIALGATYDPRHCLRIYFTSRAASEPRFVIGHVGRHLTVQTSS